MAISGLVITLSANPKRAQRAIDAIAAKPELDLGRRQTTTPRRQPAVLETRSPDDDSRICEWLRRLPGVELVDVVFVSVDPVRKEQRG